jgi:hypothetical protein
MKIRRDISQGSLEWLQARAGVVTASEMNALITPLGKMRDSKGVDTYLAQKLAEKWTGGPIAGAMTLDMELGKILEEEARPFAALHLGVDIEQVGFITTDCGKVGCSPDGLIGEDTAIEIKCPRASTHVGYLLAGGVPGDYFAQVHSSLHVTGFKRWLFMSYCRGLPPLFVTVQRDEVVQATIGKALAQFLVQFDAAWEKLVAINGGPPRQRAPLTYVPKPKPETTLHADGVTP